jgi:membrane protein
MGKIEEIFKRNRTIRKLVIIAKRFTIPGFEGVPIYNVLRLFVKAIIDGDIAQRASAINFSFFLALFPTLLFFFTLIPFIPVDGFQDELISLIERALPDATNESVLEVIDSIIILPHSGVLSLGFVLALFFSSNGFKSIIIAFNSSIHIKEDRPFFNLQFVSLVLVVMFSLTTIIVISTFITERFLLNFLMEHSFIKNEFIYFILLVSDWLIFIGMIFFMVSFLYYYAPKQRKKFRLVSAGSTFTTIIIIIVIYLFNMYINNFGKYNLLYGSIGTLLIVLLWIYINAFILLIGFEINSSIVAAKDSELLEAKKWKVFNKNNKTLTS